MNKNTIWVTGASGKLGAVLVKILKLNRDYKLIATDMDVDITDMSAVEQAASVYRPNIIINCAGLSDEQYCEQNMVQAFRVNALGARNLAAVSRQHNAKIIQMSTDDVFYGKDAVALTEFDMPNPVTVYGKSKLAGENFVRELNPKHLIIRSSWVYGIGRGDFFSYVVEKGQNHTPFDVPLDRISTPTSAIELAKFIHTLLEHTEYGTYHASCEGTCSRCEFAQAILEEMGFEPSLAKGVFSGEEHEMTCTILENLMMKMTDVYEMPQWQSDLKEYVEIYNRGGEIDGKSIH